MAKKYPDGSVDAIPFLEELLGPLTFGRNMKAIRECDEITQTVFAEKLGVSKQQLSDIENDRRGVSVERAAEWVKILGYSPTLFIELAVQAQLRAAGLPFVVTVQAEEKPKRSRRRAA